MGMLVLREYAIAAYFARCRIFRIFQQGAHIAYFSPHKLALSTAVLMILISLCFYLNQYSIYEDSA